MTPKRLQRKRHRGYRMPPCVYVGRGSKYGNPFRVVERFGGIWIVIDTLDWDAPEPEFASRDDAQAHAVARFIDYMRTHFLPLDDLRGHDLACWCRLCDVHKDGKPMGVECPDCAPCHADVLLEAAAGEFMS